MLTLKAALEEATAAIGRIDAQVLVAHLLGVDRAYLAAHPMRVLTEAEDARIDSFVAQRSLGQPVAYLIRKREFYGREFLVGPDVLIPRPETETLVEAALARLDCLSSSTVLRNHGASCLDLGTGSGAIAVTLACERPDARVTGTDANETALAVARANAESIAGAGRVEFLPGSWYGPLAGRRFDLIVSNPPYVAARDPHLRLGDLRFEPASALTDGSPDGLDAIRAIVAGAPAHLEPGGWLLVEHGYDQKAAVAAIFERAGFTERISIDDLAGIARVAGGRSQGFVGADFAPLNSQEKEMSVQDTIREQVTGHPVVLYMKGSPKMPQCGFSASATQMLKMCGVESAFTVDVLQNPDIREGVKQYANWPTVPQLYVNGEFVGGCDIMREMYQSGELQKLLSSAK